MSQLSVNYVGSESAYAVIRRATDSFVWDGSAFVAWDDADIADYAVAMTDAGGDLWQSDYPADLPAASLTVFYYEQAGGSPATSDLLLNSEDVTWNGATAVPGSATTQGRYISDVTLRAYLGSLNLDISSESDPQSDGPNAANIGRAIDYAEQAVESQLAGVFKLTDGVGLTWEDDAILGTDSRSLSLIQDACHQLAGWRLNKWRAVQSVSENVTQPVVDAIAASMEADAKAALTDWRLNPARLYEVDRVAASATSAIQTDGGITAKVGARKWYPGSQVPCGWFGW